MMIKCLYCDEMMINNTEYEFDMVMFCGKDHYQVRKEGILVKECWPDTDIPGHVTTIRVFDFSYKMWKNHNLRVTLFWDNYWSRFCDMYNETISRKKYEISESRKMWLLCAKRLGVVPDVRKLIGKMMNLEPFEYWKEKAEWTNCLLS